VHLWRQAVERAGSVATDAVRQVLREGLEVAAPGGPLRLDPRTQHCWKPFRLGRITAERQFEVVHESDGPLEPDPFPEVAFPGWSCDWTQGGLVAGPEVRIDGGL
jgi:urea transport system substrate-binding protein